MTKTEFTHLHVHSEYSLLDGAARVNDLAQTASALGMKALALTDHGVMYGAIPFYQACRKHGVKPIIGCEVYLTVGSRTDKAPRQEQPIYHLLLLAKNKTGYQNLLRLCSRAQLEGFHYKPRVDFDLLKQHAQGLICTSACMKNDIAQHLLQDKWDEAVTAATRYRSIFGEDFYLEIQDHGMLEQKKLLPKMVELSRETGIELLATNDVHYIKPQDHFLQDILICIGTGKTMADPERLKIPTDQLYLKSADEMHAQFQHLPQALDNSMRIAEKCQLELDLGQQILPLFEPLPEQLSSADYLQQLCEKGIPKRYAEDQRWSDESFKETVKERLGHELKIIDSMGYNDYFLIVWDFIRYARQRGIAVGPGRGSSAGSLVAYTLGITDVDPLRYGLLFERFLNPERISMPDIDIDFSDERRDEVIEYVVDKYGKDHVAQIITFGTMAARAAIRDVGRVLNMPYAVVDKAAKQIPGQPGMTIEKALKTSPELSNQAASDRQLAELLEHAKKVEGLPRHVSTHAAGVVLSRHDLTDYTPIQEGTANVPLTQYSMEHLESVGLLKMDFLGLRTLSIVERALQWISKIERQEINFQAMEPTDAATYDMLSRGDTLGVFQLESAGMRKVLRELKPSSFEDIISVLALYRPGPMEFIPKYIEGKYGLAEIQYPHQALEPILKETYGIIVYQEQIMQIAAVMAGFSLGEADLLRRAVSKKKREILNEQRAAFVRGSVRQGYTEADADMVYDMIVRFADYGFPKAHATAYGVLAYQTAYLKANYPISFMASMLTAVRSNHKKVAEYIESCRKMNIAVLPPDINESDVLFSPTQAAQEEGAIRIGLAVIKNVGTQAMRSIIECRREQKYEDLLDFCRRVDLKACNKKVIEALILSGAMDALPGHRAQLLAMLDETLEAAQKWKKEKEDLQIHLFGFEEQMNWTIEYPQIEPFSSSEILDYEREMVGLYLSGHPLDRYQEKLADLGLTPLHELENIEEESLVHTAGMILSVRKIVSRKGQEMGFVVLEDVVDQIELVVFPKVWAKCSSLLDKGQLIAVSGRIQHQEEHVKLLVDRCYELDQLEDKNVLQSSYGKQSKVKSKGQHLYIRIAKELEQGERLNALKLLLNRHRGELGVILYYERTKKTLALKESIRVSPSAELLAKIKHIFGEDAVRIK